MPWCHLPTDRRYVPAASRPHAWLSPVASVPRLDPPETATGLNNLARLYQAMGVYDQALPLYQRALKIRERVLGPEHPDTLWTMNNLGILYFTAGDRDEALKHLEEAVRLQPNDPAFRANLARAQAR